MISCRNVIKLVKYDLWFTHVEVALTNGLNFFPFFIFADLFPPTDRIWNFWLSRHIFLICSWFGRVKKKHLVLFSAFKSVSFFFFSIFLTLVTLYLEMVQRIYVECTKLDRKALLRFHCSSLYTRVNAGGGYVFQYDWAKCETEKNDTLPLKYSSRRSYWREND